METQQTQPNQRFNLTIKTDHVKPPIFQAFDWFDWRAYVDGREDDAQANAWGKTEQEAVCNLLEQLGVTV